MGVAAGPNVVEDGLVLALDAGNPKNYNAGISTNWTDKVGGNNGILVNGTYHNDGPFVGAGYVEFDGNTDKLSCTPSNLTGEFTIEGWWYAEAFPATTVLFGNWGGGCLMRLANAGAELQWYTSGLLSGMSGSIGFTLSTGTWYHVAVSRDSSNVHRTFVNGTQIANDTNSDSISMSNLCIGSENTSSGTTDIWNGYISNFRIVDGTALYTSNFTPPTGPLEAIDDTALLTCQGGAIIDNGPNSHAITINNDAEAITASAFEFDGTNDYVQVPNSSALQLGTGDFTIEMWWYMIGSGNCRGFTLGDASDANGMELYVGNSGASLYVYIQNAIRITADSVPSFDAWHHYVIERTGGTMKLYVDGVVQSGTYSSSQSLGTGTDGDLRLGVEYYSSSLNFVGDCKISNFKIYKGKGLTEDEVKRNFSALRGRYGI